MNQSSPVRVETNAEIFHSAMRSTKDICDEIRNATSLKSAHDTKKQEEC